MDIFSNSICPEKQYLAAFIYIDLLILIPIMLFALSLFNMELINKTPYDFKFTFLRPWLLWGICPIFEMPLMVFDHYNCKMQSPLYSYPESYSIMNAFGILFLIIFGIFVGFLTCLMSNLNCAGLMNCFKKTLLNFIGPAILIVLNMLAFLLTFTQIQFYLPVLYFHNYSYYLMLIMMIIFYVLLFGCKMQGKFHIDEKIVEFSKVIN